MHGLGGRKIFPKISKILLKFGTAEPLFDPELGKFMRIERNNLRNVKPICKCENLGSTPEIRADVVARGKALIADPNYPSKQQIGKIATLLAAKWDGGLPAAEAPRRDNTLHVAAV
jgi:hypothetical protein